jgi:phosphoglycolate phosphatase
MLRNKKPLFRKHVIFWDWNGTILNDAQICINAMNALRKRYDYTPIDKETYEDTFDFPVEKYYREIGWDFEKHPFRDIGLEFMNYYQSDIPRADIQKGVKAIIENIRAQQKQQFLISAMENSLLYRLVQHFGMHHLFDEVKGIEDHYGKSKEHLFQQLITSHKLNTKNIVMIGDTLHDAEIAQKLHIDCLLFYSGHQSETRLKKAGCPVFYSYHQLAEMLSVE